MAKLYAGVASCEIVITSDVDNSGEPGYCLSWLRRMGVWPVFTRRHSIGERLKG